MTAQAVAECAPPSEHVLPEIKPYTGAAGVRWDEYVKRVPGGTFCHLSGWQRVIESTWQHRNHSLYAERAGQIAGVLPLFHVSSRLFGSMLLSTPNAVYGGVLARDASARQALLNQAKRLAKELRVDYLELRNTPELHAEAESDTYQSFHQQDQLYVSFEQPLTADEDAWLSGFPRDVRRMIRQGPKHGLTAEVRGADALDDFYEVYAYCLRKLGTPVFPKQLFAGFLRVFPDNADILVIRQRGKFAGAVLSFYFNGTVLPYYAGAYPEFYRAGINNFMYAELMRQSAARGCTRFDFGRSKRGTGAYEFKRGWNMQERALPYQFYLVNAQQLPQLNPTNPKFKWLIETWKRLPLTLTKLIGPAVVKYLP